MQFLDMEQPWRGAVREEERGLGAMICARERWGASGSGFGTLGTDPWMCALTAEGAVNGEDEQGAVGPAGLFGRASGAPQLAATALEHARARAGKRAPKRGCRGRAGWAVVCVGLG